MLFFQFQHQPTTKWNTLKKNAWSPLLAVTRAYSSDIRPPLLCHNLWRQPAQLASTRWADPLKPPLGSCTHTLTHLYTLGGYGRFFSFILENHRAYCKGQRKQMSQACSHPVFLSVCRHAVILLFIVYVYVMCGDRGDVNYKQFLPLLSLSSSSLPSFHPASFPRLLSARQLSIAVSPSLSLLSPLTQ